MTTISSNYPSDPSTFGQSSSKSSDSWDTGFGSGSAFSASPLSGSKIGQMQDGVFAMQQAYMNRSETTNNSLVIEAQDMDHNTQARNALNAALSKLQAAKYLFGPSAGPDDTLNKQKGYGDNDYQIEREANQALADAGITLPFPGHKGLMGDGTRGLDGTLDGSVTLAKLSAVIDDIKMKADNLGNNQSKEMLMLQKLDNDNNVITTAQTTTERGTGDRNKAIAGNFN